MSQSKGGGGGNQPKAVNGIQVGMSIAPEDMYNDKSMAGTATILFIGGFAVFLLNKLVKPVAKYIFGVSADQVSKVGLPKDQVFNAVRSKEGDFADEQIRNSLIQSTFNTLSPEMKQKAVGILNSQMGGQQQEKKEPEAPAKEKK